MKTAVVVLATGDYWKGAKVLFHTLHKYGNLPSIVTPIALGMEQCDFAEGVPIRQDYSWVKVNQYHFPKVADKLFALTLPFDRVILIDADILCLGDCSLLWSIDWLPLPFYAVRDVASYIYYQKVVDQICLNPNLLFNAGTMVFDLNQFDYKDFIQSVADGNLQSYDGGDQGYLNHWFQRERIPFGFLPLEYNACTDGHYPRMEEGTERLVHFTGSNVKPWDAKIDQTDRRWKYVARWQEEWEACS
jgi:lipopolysaccharide biosynthesis glycosyltransferase